MARTPERGGRSSLRRLATITTTFGVLAVGAVGPASVDAQLGRQGLLSLEDARIYYEVVGSGDPIIVVHGGPGLDHKYLRPGLDALARSNTLVYYDQRGTGRSITSLEPGTINFDDFVDDIDAIREALGYERVSVLAHSFGVLMGLEYATRYPARLRALILMNPPPLGSRFTEEISERQGELRTREDSTELASLRASEGFAARDPGTLSQVYRVMYRQAFRDRNRIADLDLELAPTTAQNGQDVAELLGSSVGEVDWWDRLGEIEAPTLVLHGRFDIPPVDMSIAMAEALPVGTFAVLDSGHFPYVEDREGLLAAISGFFAGLRP
jgi:proline iminopeptidase